VNGVIGWCVLKRILPKIDTHKEEIGLQYFPQLQEYLTEFVLRGLTESRPRIKRSENK